MEHSVLYVYTVRYFWTDRSIVNAKQPAHCLLVRADLEWARSKCSEGCASLRQPYARKPPLAKRNGPNSAEWKLGIEVASENGLGFSARFFVSTCMSALPGY